MTFASKQLQEVREEILAVHTENTEKFAYFETHHIKPVKAEIAALHILMNAHSHDYRIALANPDLFTDQLPGLRLEFTRLHKEHARLYDIVSYEPPEFKERRYRYNFLGQRLDTLNTEYERIKAEMLVQNRALIDVLDTATEYLLAYRKRALPSRRGVTHRGVGFTGETNEELEARILPRFQAICHIQFIDNSLDTEDDLFYWQKSGYIHDPTFTFSRTYISLFRVHIPGHVFRGIFIPGMDARPDTLVIINTWRLSDTMYRALRSTPLLATCTILPNDLVGVPQNLQREDTTCFGAGQCQHWSYITAYVFLKMFAEQGYFTKVVSQELYTRVWQQLEALGTMEAYNAMQREITLLGGASHRHHCA